MENSAHDGEHVIIAGKRLTVDAVFADWRAAWDSEDAEHCEECELKLDR